MAYRYHIVIGHVGETIVRFVTEQQIQAICARGSGLAELLMGSVASKVLALCTGAGEPGEVTISPSFREVKNLLGDGTRRVLRG